MFCTETIAELETHLWRPKFDRDLSIERRHLLLHDLRAVGEWFELPAAPKQTYSRDPDNDKFVHLTLTAQADWLISGNQDLLDVPAIPGLRIDSRAQALDVI